MGGTINAVHSLVVPEKSGWAAESAERDESGGRVLLRTPPPPRTTGTRSFSCVNSNAATP